MFVETFFACFRQFYFSTQTEYFAWAIAFALVKCPGDTLSRLFVKCYCVFPLFCVTGVFLRLECRRCGITEPRSNRNWMGEGVKRRSLPSVTGQGHKAGLRRIPKRNRWRLKRSPYARNLCQPWFCSLRNLTKFHGEVFSGMFNSCTIHSGQINFNRPKDA